MRAILQSESSECGLACLAMIATHHGRHTDLLALRIMFPSSNSGHSLDKLIGYAEKLGLSSRPVKLELDEIHLLKTPCILHWDLDHFVILKKFKRNLAIILDPAAGERRFSLKNMSKHFTGIACEFTPNHSFKKEKKKEVQIAQLFGNVTGLKKSLSYVLSIAVVLEAFSIAIPLLNQKIFDDVLPTGDTDLLSIFCIGLTIATVTHVYIGFVRSWLVLSIGQIASLQLSNNLFAHLVKLPVPWFESRGVGDISTKFQSIAEIQKIVTNIAIEAFIDGAMSLIALLMMYLYSPKLAAVVVLAVTLYGIIRWIGFYPIRRATSERIILHGKERSHFFETLRASATIKIFGKEADRACNWGNLFTNVLNQDYYIAKTKIGFSSIQSLIFALENTAVLWIGVSMVVTRAASTNSGNEFTLGKR